MHEERFEPKLEDERWRLKQMHGRGAENVPLTKGEVAKKKAEKDRRIRAELEKLRRKLGIKEKGGQEEFLFDD